MREGWSGYRREGYEREKDRGKERESVEQLWERGDMENVRGIEKAKESEREKKKK